MSELAAAEGVGAIVDLQHHPFGNSYFPTPECGGSPYDADKRHCFEQRCAGQASAPADCFTANMSAIVVQHGVPEYQFNRMQACAKDITVLKGEAWYTRYWTFVACIEDKYSDGIGAATRACIGPSNFTRRELDYLRSCFDTSSGDASVVREAKATIDHPGTPTVLVNGKASSPSGALKDVCAAYKGPPPAGCSDLGAGLVVEEQRAGEKEREPLHPLHPLQKKEREPPCA